MFLGALGRLTDEDDDAVHGQTVTRFNLMATGRRKKGSEIEEDAQ